MGKIYNFEKLTFSPFQSRIGNIQVRNFWMKDGTPKTLQSHLKLAKFSFFEIVKFEKNPHFGKYQEYLENGYEESFGGEFLQKDHMAIDKNSFDREESCFTLASWDNINHDELTPDLKFCGSRPFDLSKTELDTFMQLSLMGQKEIERQLNELTNEDEDGDY
jgi:hypothetical protein